MHGTFTWPAVAAVLASAPEGESILSLFSIHPSYRRNYDMPNNKPTGPGNTNRPQDKDKNDNREKSQSQPQSSTPTRGSSNQGEKQDAKGGPAGANQGGAPRGGSRVEPSHQRDQQKKDR